MEGVDGNMQFVTQKEVTLYYDRVSGRYFESTRADIEELVNKINKRLIYDYGFVAEYSPEDVERMISEELGFETRFYDKISIHYRQFPWGRIDADMIPTILDDGRPCFAIIWVYFYTPTN
jgi:hypothetical protein